MMRKYVREVVDMEWSHWSVSEEREFTSDVTKHIRISYVKRVLKFKWQSL